MYTAFLFAPPAPYQDRLLYLEAMLDIRRTERNASRPVIEPIRCDSKIAGRHVNNDLA